MDTLIIKIADKADSNNLSLLLSRAFEPFKDIYSKEAFAATVIPPEEFVRRMDEGPLWIAVKDNILLGTVSLLPKGEEGYIRGMAVLPAAQGLGIGLALLQSAEQFAVDKQYKRLFLRTTPYLDKAIKLYEQFGFVRVGTTMEDFFGTPSFLMEKYLIESKL